MINDGDYATPAIMCRAKPGVCFTEGKCGSCEDAEKHKLNTKFFEIMQACQYKCRKGICVISTEPCSGIECERTWNLARELI